MSRGRRRQIRPPDRDSPPPDRDPSPADSATTGDDDDAHAAADPSTPRVPFYNTTFSAHRVSPLYLGREPLIPARLQTLAHRLRDRLVGDVVRGVEVGLGPPGQDAGGLGRAGALEAVDVRWVSVADVLGARHLRGKRALHIALRYEFASCTALLLPPLNGEGDGAEHRTGRHGRAAFSVAAAAADGSDLGRNQAADSAHFLALPLLLLRMPAPLKAVIADFLSVTFDCRVSPMRLGTRSLVASWEAWIRSAGLPSRGPFAKDVVLSLGFHVPPPVTTKAAAAAAAEAGSADKEEGASGDRTQLGLKSIDVIIPAAELRRFVAAGKRLAAQARNKRTAPARWGWEDDLRKRRRLAGRLYEEGWEWRMQPADRDGDDGKGGPERQPFTEALACYLKEHLALNLFHPGVQVIKIACGGFVMSESRLKLFTPADLRETGDDETPSSSLGQMGAVVELLGGLVEKAQIREMAG